MAEAQPGPARGARHIRSFVLGATIVSVVALGLPKSRVPLLIYNASASAPIGFYRVFPVTQLHAGDLVLAIAPQRARQLASDRGYLPNGVPLVKRVAALSGDRVCSEGRSIKINGTAVAVALAGDRAGRPLADWHGCRVLGPSEIFLLMADVIDSFDSRYFGPVKTDAVVGTLVPLWIERHS
jgi:conjugative transfer signal peptidase TraF